MIAWQHTQRGVVEQAPRLTLKPGECHAYRGDFSDTILIQNRRGKQSNVLSPDGHCGLMDGRWVGLIGGAPVDRRAGQAGPLDLAFTREMVGVHPGGRYDPAPASIWSDLPGSMDGHGVRHGGEGGIFSVVERRNASVRVAVVFEPGGRGLSVLGVGVVHAFGTVDPRVWVAVGADS